MTQTHVRPMRASSTSGSGGRRSPRLSPSVRRWGLSFVAPVILVAAWQVISSLGLMSPLLLPSPSQVVSAGVELIRDGTMGSSAGISLFRIFSGWIIGSAVGGPIGLLIGAFPTVRRLLDPILHFFRFVPAISLITIFMIWFGVGETSKVMLIVYSSAFIVTVNTATGVVAIPKDKVNAARCLGAGRRTVFFRVIAPATVPYIFVGMRLALASAFLVIVGVEMIAANSGLGYLTWVSRIYFHNDWVFATVVVIGIFGFVSDRLWGLFGRKILPKYLGQVKGY